MQLLNSNNSIDIFVIQYDFTVFNFDDILVSSGEKMSYQVTILLAEIIYMDMLRSTVPVFESVDFGQTPLLLVLFALSITCLCFYLLKTTGTLISINVRNTKQETSQKQRPESVVV